MEITDNSLENGRFFRVIYPPRSPLNAGRNNFVLKRFQPYKWPADAFVDYGFSKNYAFLGC